MPIRVGFAHYRLQLLQDELDKIIDRLPQLGVTKAILLDPLFPGIVEPDTGLKMVMVMDVDWPFVRRPDFFYSHLSPTVGVEFLVYTPREFQDVQASTSYLSRALQRSEVIYEE